MKILVSNDDGYLSLGIKALADSLASIAEVIVIAPDRNQSGASHALTLNTPLRVSIGTNNFYRVEGTPADCVHLGVTGLLKDPPDMVISGINIGANLGDDVIYSGTVAAAMEGRFLGLPSIAVSLVSPEPKHFGTAAWVTCELVRRIIKNPLPADTILNVNIPDIPKADIKGFRATRLGCRHQSGPIIRDTDPSGHPIYWVGPSGESQDSGLGTDFYAISQGEISITPIQVDLTSYKMLDKLSQWLA
ncbi:5'/3'-nucleotidase SurE [Candidatus Nitrosacidococcus tergens]|uniref:5'-nucleotidase SurE n=1 Tax=Candidatus Nitrosacidococcus tergens TaxID=553981 RepID=A0A7G1Q841_9GAMM|nr:5'/3'-nucleotidase SurE [Candidatus Nitrosacidococcus tergens]CAB1274875.1 broad specificity 5'(3')-nucleotidase and polyphosphatase [Candidatus Nitrosacidococcus tergens]